MLNRFWWGSVFLINVPVIVVFLCLAPILLKEVHGSRPGRIDILSIVLSATGLLLAIYGVKHAATYGVDRLNVTLVMVGIIILVIFFVWQKRLEAPLLDVRLFEERVFAVAVLTGLLSLFVWSAAAI